MTVLDKTTRLFHSGTGQKAIAPILLRCYSYLRPYWRLSLGAYLAMLGITLISIATPQLIRWIIDEGITAGNRSLLAGSVLALLGLNLVRGVLTFFQGRWSEVASQNVAADLRGELQHKLTALSFSFHDRSQAGDILSRAIQDVDRIRFLTGRASLRVIDGATLMIATGRDPLLDEPAAGAAGGGGHAAAGVARRRFWGDLPPAFRANPEAAGGADHAGGAEPARRARGEGLCPGKQGD